MYEKKDERPNVYKVAVLVAYYYTGNCHTGITCWGKFGLVRYMKRNIAYIPAWFGSLIVT